MKNNLSECIIAHKCIDDNVYLAKNRDRAYDSRVKIVRELVDGIEICYISDLDTDWSEGLNEYGIGTVNTALMVNYDEKEKKIVKKKGEYGPDGEKMRKALGHKKLSEVLKSLVYYYGNDEEDVGVKGHTFVANPKYSFSIEVTSKHLPIVKKLNRKLHHIRTNHGYSYPDSGYKWKDGPDYKSSHMRHKLAQKEIDGAQSGPEILSRLSKHYSNIPTYLSPYRHKEHNKKKKQGLLSTTGQILMNLNDPTLELRIDKDHGKFYGVEDRTPNGYEPKIKIIKKYTKFPGRNF